MFKTKYNTRQTAPPSLGMLIVYARVCVCACVRMRACVPCVWSISCRAAVLKDCRTFEWVIVHMKWVVSCVRMRRVTDTNAPCCAQFAQIKLSILIPFNGLLAPTLLFKLKIIVPNHAFVKTVFSVGFSLEKFDDILLITFRSPC